MTDPPANFWDFLTNLVNQFFDFLKSRNGLILILLLALLLGVLNMKQIKELIEAVKGLFG